MANRNPGLSQDTEQVLTWAAQAQERDDTVREIWKALCDRFDVSTTATGEGVLRLLRKAGSPEIADIFRDEPAHYPEVCWCIAEKLRSMFDDAECTEEDILVCEKYVLERMGIPEDGIGTLCSAIRDRGKSEAKEEGAAKTIRIAAVEGVAVSAARMARKEAAEKAMHEASKKVAAEVENQVAKLVLAEILIAVDVALAELTLIGTTVPAYRKAIPGVIYVALLRKLHAAESAFRAGAANKPMKRTPWHPRWQGNAGRRGRHARTEAGVGIRVQRGAVRPSH
jgi:hypothetical protein